MNYLTVLYVQRRRNLWTEQESGGGRINFMNTSVIISICLKTSINFQTGLIGIKVQTYWSCSSAAFKDFIYQILVHVQSNFSQINMSQLIFFPDTLNCLKCNRLGIKAIKKCPVEWFLLIIVWSRIAIWSKNSKGSKPDQASVEVTAPTRMIP